MEKWDVQIQLVWNRETSQVDISDYLLKCHQRKRRRDGFDGWSRKFSAVDMWIEQYTYIYSSASDIVIRCDGFLNANSTSESLSGPYTRSEEIRIYRNVSDSFFLEILMEIHDKVEVKEDSAPDVV